MRRAAFAPAMGLIFFVLIMAPFSHIHYEAEGARFLGTVENRAAVVHSHFGEEPDSSPRENGRREDFDHSPEKTKLLVSAALRSSAARMEAPSGEPPASIIPIPLAIALRSAPLADVSSIHGPPELRRLSLRAPPADFPA
jgi:hypothetical protein